MNAPKKQLLVTDLDDTLYGWLAFFVPAFYAMLAQTAKILGVSEATLIAEYRQAHAEVSSVEVPYTTLNLPAVKAVFPTLDRDERKEKLRPAFEAFNAERRQKLRLYPGVKKTLQTLKKQNVRIVGYTDSAPENGLQRLTLLNIAHYFTHVYCSKSRYRGRHEPFAQAVEVAERKPNKAVLLEILAHENVAPANAIYVGDSVSKDIYMAKSAGVTAVLMSHPPAKAEYQRLLEDISDWQPEEFERERRLKKDVRPEDFEPNLTVKRYDEILELF